VERTEATYHLHSNTKTTHLPKRVCIGPETSTLSDGGISVVVQTPVEPGSVLEPPENLQNSELPTSNQLVSNMRDITFPGETPSSTTSCSNDLLQVDIGADIDMELVAIANTAVAELLALNGGTLDVM
jgi:hypothetical protein